MNYIAPGKEQQKESGEKLRLCGLSVEVQNFYRSVKSSLACQTCALSERNKYAV
jgi:hypothetical protein